MFSAIVRRVKINIALKKTKWWLTCTPRASSIFLVVENQKRYNKSGLELLERTALLQLEQRLESLS